MKDLIQQIRQSTIFLGKMNNNVPIFTGTGFLVQVDDVFYVVTAKHVVEKDYQNMYIFQNNKNFGVNLKPIADIMKQGFEWKKHKDSKVDIALLPFPLDPTDKIKFIPDKIFVKDIDELQSLVDLFYISFQPGINSIKDDNSIDPIIRKGVISRINANKTFYMDGFAFPGNSGSPVFTLPTPVKIQGNQVSIGGPIEIKLAGIIGAYVPYKDEAVSKQTGEVRAVFTENTGIALVHSNLLLREIIDSDDFKEQHNRLTNVNKDQTDSDKKSKPASSKLAKK